MKPIDILVDSLADEGLTNAQMINAREIVSRLNPDRFHVTMFVSGRPAPQISARPNTRLIGLPSRLRTLPILSRFLFGPQEILFYLKASPASRWYLKLPSARRNRCTIVGTIESQSDLEQDATVTPGAKRLMEETILRCNYLFSNSAKVQSSLQSHYGLPSEIVPTGVDITEFTPNWNRPPNPRVRILFVGALRTFKGPQIVLQAAQCFPQADFVLVGGGVMAEELRQRSKVLSNVELRGPLGRTAVREEFARADIFMFPSRWEGSPRVLMEAAACGLPVIARRDYEPETVLDGMSGFLAGSDAEMLMQLAPLIEDANLRRRMGECGRAHIARFSWDVITRQWESIFTRLALQHRNSARRNGAPS
jgi:glycosyltransferase involved in cell wall biosynthesis